MYLFSFPDSFVTPPSSGTNRRSAATRQSPSCDTPLPEHSSSGTRPLLPRPTDWSSRLPIRRRASPAEVVPAATNWSAISWSNRPHAVSASRAAPTNRSSHHSQRSSISIRSLRLRCPASSWFPNTICTAPSISIRLPSSSSSPRELPAMYCTCLRATPNRLPDRKRCAKPSQLCTAGSRCRVRRRCTLRCRSRESRWPITPGNCSSGEWIRFKKKTFKTGKYFLLNPLKFHVQKTLSGRDHLPLWPGSGRPTMERPQHIWRCASH